MSKDSMMGLMSKITECWTCTLLDMVTRHMTANNMNCSFVSQTVKLYTIVCVCACVCVGVVVSF